MKQRFTEPAKYILRWFILAIPLVLYFVCLCSLVEGKNKTGDIVTSDVDWQNFLARNDPIWERLSDEWKDGAFIGNGLLGAMVYKDSPGALRWQLGRTDVISRQRQQGIDWSIPRLPVGHILIEPVGKVLSEKMRLDLWNAEVVGTIETNRGAISFRSFVHATEPVILIELSGSGDEKDAAISFRPEHGISPRIPWEGYKADTSKLPPVPVNKQVDGVDVTVQQLLAGGEYATGSKIINLGSNHRLVLVTVANSPLENHARATAAADINRLSNLPLNTLVKSHRNFWHAYYPASFVSLPDPVWESFYWIQMYKHASATRPGGTVIDNQGPWLTRTAWPGTWWNLNVQLSYSPVYTANRLEQGHSLCETLYTYRANLADNVPSLYRKNGEVMYHLERYSTYDLSGGLSLPFVHELGNLTWALHNCWRQYRYSMDDNWLRNQLFPLLRGNINLYLQMLKKRKDGRLHIPSTHSPEYMDPAMFRDANYALAMLRWGLQTLLAINERLNLNDALQPLWKETLDSLTDFPQNENGLMVGKGQPFDTGHRHFSHLTAIFPLFLLDPEEPRDLPLIETSFRRWLELGYGTPNFNGYSYTAASSIYSALGNGDMALKALNSALDMFSPSTMYLEGGGPVIETPFAASESIHDMLLQSRKGILRVFPALPGAWRNVVFHNLRAEGAFLVSAIRRDGKTRQVRIKSLAGEICRLKTDLARPIHFAGPSTFAINEQKGGIMELSLKTGEEVVLYSEQDIPEFHIKPVVENAAETFYNHFGLKQ